MNTKHYAFASLFIVFMSLTLSGQQTQHPFANLKGWERVSTDNFDIYFQSRDYKGAVKVAKYAELARYELGLFYDYAPQQRFSLLYTGSADALFHSNLDYLPDDKLPGTFLLPNRTRSINHPGSSKELYHEVRRAVSLEILEEFSGGEGIGGNVQNQLLSFTPSWFREGLSNYVATGWTFEDEQWISNLRQRDDLLELALEGDDAINRVVRKSVWHFIAHEYGDQKISEIIYLANIANSVESGIISVLGITLNTLTERWREFTLSRVSTRLSGRMDISSIPGAKLIPLRAKEKLSGFAYNASRQIMALYLNRSGKQHVALYDVEKGSYVHTDIHSGFNSIHADLLHFEYPMAWNHSGDVLATVSFKGAEPQLVYFDLNTSTVSYFPVDREIRQISQLSWSHDDQSLALSALKGDQMQLFTTSSSEANLRQLTNGPFDKLDPAWSLDDQKIYFSSNQDSSTYKSPESVWQAHENNYDLFVYNLGNNKVQRLTKSPTINERSPYIISSANIGFISDRYGVHNLDRLKPGSRQFETFSNLAIGFKRVQGHKSYVAASSPIAGKETLFLLRPESLKSTRPVQATVLRNEYNAAFQDQRNRRERENELRQQELDRITQPRPNSSTPQVNIPDTPRDTARVKEPVRYYLFDEDREPYEVSNTPAPIFEPANNSTATVLSNVFGQQSKPKLSEVNVSAPVRARAKWTADYMEFLLGYDPVAGYGLQFNVGFSDVMKNHRLSLGVTPYFNLRNQDAFLRYEYLKHRIDFYGEARVKNRFFRRENAFFPLDSLVFQFDNILGKVGATYPISSSFSVSAEFGYNYLNRSDLQLTRPELFDQSDHMFIGSVKANFNNVQQREGFKYKGVEGQLSINNFYSSNQNEFRFHTIQADVKHYIEIFDKIILASHISAGLSFNLRNNNGKLQFVNDSSQLFYLGGVENQLLGLLFEDETENTIEFSDVSPDLYDFQYQGLLSPSRGFDFFTRSGTKYVLSNFELRIPLSRLVKHTLNSNALYNLELIPFMDVGTVWTEGNPFSQKKPTDTQFISNGPISVQLQTLKSPFLFGFGSGLRTNIVGYSLRLDIAWGVDDNTLQSPIFTASLGRNF